MLQSGRGGGACVAKVKVHCKTNKPRSRLAAGKMGCVKGPGERRNSRRGGEGRHVELLQRAWTSR